MTSRPDGRLLEIANAAVVATDDHAFRTDALRVVCTSLEADSASLIAFGGVLPIEVMGQAPTLLHQYTRPSNRLASSVRGGEALAAVPYLNHYLVFRERFDRELQRAWQHALRSDCLFLGHEVFSEAEWQSSGLYSELFAPNGIECLLGALLTTPLGAAGMLLVGRHDKARGFDRTKLTQWLPLLRLLGLLTAGFSDNAGGAPAERSAPSAAVQRLSFRERRVSEMISHGMTNREIATALALSPNTVRNQIAALFAKIGVRNRSELVSWAFEHSAIKRA